MNCYTVIKKNQSLKSRPRQRATLDIQLKSYTTSGEKYDYFFTLNNFKLI